MIKFTNEQDYFKALTEGPWTILDHYLIVHQWDQSFRVSSDLPRKMVVWVRFPHLPIHYYHAQVLTSLGNLLARPSRSTSIHSVRKGASLPVFPSRLTLMNRFPGCAPRWCHPKGRV
ncbi:hypothetical protein LINPERHAP2_LOCUS33086 [Linum perenne]